MCLHEMSGWLVIVIPQDKVLVRQFLEIERGVTMGETKKETYETPQLEQQEDLRDITADPCTYDSPTVCTGG
jgi:hypothetical protein